MTDQVAALVYGLAAWSVYRALHRSWRGELSWALCVIALATLAFDRQFAILDGVVDRVRILAWQGAWYGERAQLQQALVVGIGLGAVTMIAGALTVLRHHDWQLRLTVATTIALMALAGIKAVSLHGLDAFFAQSIGGPWPLHLTLGRGMMMIGIAAVVLASMAVAPLVRRVPPIFARRR